MQRRLPFIQMFDRNKQADETSAASAQGVERKGIEESVHQENNSLSLPGPEASGLPVMQNRQGYCNCCHVHYRNLEQHLSSSQHRHVATSCRNRMGTASLMDRFLEDVLQHHPCRYHDNRPTYNDIPLASARLPRDEAPLSLDLTEKERTASRGREPSTDSGFTAESGCLISQRSHEEIKKAFPPVALTQRIERGQEHALGTSRKPADISCSSKNPVPLEKAVSGTSTHKGPNTAVNLLPHLPLTLHILGENAKHSITPDSVSSKQCEQNKPGICNQGGSRNPHLSALFPSDHSRTIPFSCQGSACNRGNSVISGRFYWKEDGFQPQDETQISDSCLRNTSKPVGASSSLAFQASSQLPGRKESQIGKSTENSVDEVIEEVILKYCYETAPKDPLRRDEDTDCSVHLLSLLDHSSVHGSDISFDCDAVVQSGALLPKAAVKSLERLKEAQVTLQDGNYGTHLSSVLRNDSAQQPTAETEKDMSARYEEPVLPALPHVPPSFVGKTWAQIMYEDDLKIEALVRDFREGRFRCHFDTESLARCTRRRLSKKKRKKAEEERNDPVASNEREATSAEGLPELTGGLSCGGSSSSSSAVSETQHIPQTLRRAQKRSWRLASRCQVVKVSRGTQTSLAHYPVVKQKIIRKSTEPPDQETHFLWPDSEKTPTMKTRLCALKLPESYTKIMSPVQPQTVVYVLSCPERKLFRNKAEDFPEIRRSHHSTDSKDSIRYKYKPSCIKYYDPLTNRILKTPPKGLVGEKARKPPHVRQLFRSLSPDANSKKQAGAPDEFMTPKPFGSADPPSSPASSKLYPVKENDRSASCNAEGSSVSLDRPKRRVCSSSENSYKHLVLSPLNPQQFQQEDDFWLMPFPRKQVQSPLKSHGAGRLGRDHPKTGGWQRKKGGNRESGFSKKASAPAFARHNCIRRGGQAQPHRTTTPPKEGGRRRRRREVFTCGRKSSGSSAPRHTAMQATVGKHLKKEKADAKTLKVARRSKRTFSNTAGIKGISEKRQRTTPARASSKVKKWEVSGEKSLLRTVK